MRNSHQDHVQAWTPQQDREWRKGHLREMVQERCTTQQPAAWRGVKSKVRITQERKAGHRERDDNTEIMSVHQGRQYLPLGASLMMDNLDLLQENCKPKLGYSTTKPPALPFLSAEITKDKGMTEEPSRIKAVSKATRTAQGPGRILDK